MLNENDVVSAVCNHVEQHGYTILQAKNTRQTGDDVVAQKASYSRNIIQLRIEAKGLTSSKPGTNNYNKGFTPQQQRDHVSWAFFKCAEMLSRPYPDGYSVRVGIALPLSRQHEGQLNKIQPILDQLHIGVFWVTDDRRILLRSKWSL